MRELTTGDHTGGLTPLKTRVSAVLAMPLQLPLPLPRLRKSLSDGASLRSAVNCGGEGARCNLAVARRRVLRPPKALRGRAPIVPSDRSATNYRSYDCDRSSQAD